MPVSISGTNGVVFPDNSLQTAAASPFGLKNRIINGDMVIDQRNNGASVTPTANQYITDRWQVDLSQASKFTAQQSTTAPTGFSNSLLITSSSAYSVGSGDYFYIRQKIEGFNVADLAWGTANARTVTLSFWVRSSLTGTFGGSLRNSAVNRSYPFSYTISSANTWTQISVTIAGDTTGTWIGSTNGIGIDVAFNLGTGTTYSGTAGSWAATNYVSVTGATSVVGTNGATFYVTGVQLERNTTATPFEWIPYGTELALCQRYLPACISSSGFEAMSVSNNISTTVSLCSIPYQVQPRVPPTGLTVSAAIHYGIVNASGNGLNATAVTFSSASLTNAQISITVASGLTAGNASYLYCQSTSGRLLFTGCEL
jgi:hypothetical protein